MITLDLPLLNSVIGLLNTVLNLAAPLTSALNSVLSLDLKSLLCFDCTRTDIVLIPDKLHLDIGLEAAEATARLDPQSADTFKCSPKHLTTKAQSSAVKLAVGRFESTDEFFSEGTGKVKALPLIDIDTIRCGRLGLGGQPRVPFGGGGLGLRIDSKLLGSGPVEHLLVFQTPPNIGQPTAYQNMRTINDNVVGSLSETLSGVQLVAYEPTGNSGLGKVMQIAANVLAGVKGIVDPLIKSLLSPVLDAIVNVLLKVLGIDLVNAEVGANLTCSSRAQLAL